MCSSVCTHDKKIPAYEYGVNYFISSEKEANKANQLKQIKEGLCSGHLKANAGMERNRKHKERSQ
uniref:Uncharacterized protein n=1 Tax=Arundo donax TaxID=35708 RepID=A0A0A9HDG6_ARUDO